MPILELVSLQDAQVELSLSGKGGAIMRQYMDYISQLQTGRAGKLTPDVGETTASVRRRLNAAAAPRPRGSRAQERFGLPTSVTPNKTSALTGWLYGPDTVK